MIGVVFGLWAAFCFLFGYWYGYKKRRKLTERDKKLLGELLDACNYAEDRYHFENGTEAKNWLLKRIL